MSTSSDPISQFAQQEATLLQNTGTLLTTIASGILILDTLISNLQAEIAAGPTLTTAQANALAAVIAQTNQLMTQAQGINVAPPAPAAPANPTPPPAA